MNRFFLPFLAASVFLARPAAGEENPAPAGPGKIEIIENFTVRPFDTLYGCDRRGRPGYADIAMKDNETGLRFMAVVKWQYRGASKIAMRRSISFVPDLLDAEHPGTRADAARERAALRRDPPARARFSRALDRLSSLFRMSCGL